MILYVRDICPVFSVNNTTETTYYPCEGVIAVGEFKSLLDRESLRDAFEKIASVKQVRRHVVCGLIPHPNTGAPIPRMRNYLTRHEGGFGHPNEGATVEERERMEALGFVLAGECRLNGESLAKRFLGLAAEKGNEFSANLLMMLDGNLVR